MRKSVVFLGLLLLLVSCSGSGGRSSGSGVFVYVTNLHELQDVYFDMFMEPTRPTMDDLSRSLSPNADYVELFRLSTLVHNKGYSESLVAMYVTGYDPNLFLVLPLGPFLINYDSHYCYHDVQLNSDYEYSVSALCAAADDVFIGGTISNYGGSTGVSVSAYDLNINNWLSGLLGGVSDEIDRISRATGLQIRPDVHCSVDDLTDFSSSGCRISFFGFDQLGRSSRGALLLSLYGSSVRNCGNGCVLVPSPLSPDDYLGGDNELYPGGQGVYVDYGVYLDRSRWPTNYNDHNQLFQITACYLYTTYATPLVCIDPTPGNSDAEVCTAGVVKLNPGQPAPLRISRIEQVNQGRRVMFKIHVENVLGGDVFHPGGIDFCSPTAPHTYSRELVDVAQVIDARVLGSLKPLDCRDGKIRLVNGKGEIACFYEMPPEIVSGSAFQTTLNIEIGYLYRDIQTVSTSIHRV